MDSINPFKDDSFLRDAILQREGKGRVDIDPDTDNYTDLSTIVSNAPIIPQEKQIGNLILDATAIAKNDKEQKALEIKNALNTMFSDYNEKYGLDLKVDFNSLSNTLMHLSDSKSRRVLELYVSQTFRSVRSVLLLQLISRLGLVVDYITKPENMFNSSLSIPDIFVILEKLLSFIDQISDLRKDVEISGDELELQKLAESNKQGGVDMSSPESKQAIEDFMKLFNKEHNK